MQFFEATLPTQRHKISDLVQLSLGWPNTCFAIYLDGFEPVSPIIRLLNRKPTTLLDLAEVPPDVCVVCDRFYVLLVWGGVEGKDLDYYAETCAGRPKTLIVIMLNNKLRIKVN